MRVRVQERKLEQGRCSGSTDGPARHASAAESSPIRPAAGTGRERERNMLGFVCSADEVSSQSGGARLDYQKDDLRFSIGGSAGPFQHSPFKFVDARISEQV
jgi:hypothetical protein